MWSGGFDFRRNLSKKSYQIIPIMLEPDAMCFSAAAISACEMGGQWEKPLWLLDETPQLWVHSLDNQLIWLWYQADQANQIDQLKPTRQTNRPTDRPDQQTNQ